MGFLGTILSSAFSAILEALLGVFSKRADQVAKDETVEAVEAAQKAEAEKVTPDDATNRAQRGEF